MRITAGAFLAFTAVASAKTAHERQIAEVEARLQGLCEAYPDPEAAQGLAQLTREMRLRTNRVKAIVDYEPS